MKRVVTFILLTIYFTVTTGFTVNLHFCMDEYQSWEWGGSSTDACGVCGMDGEESGGCCRDEVKLVKLQEDDVDVFAPAVKQWTLPALARSFALTTFPPPVWTANNYFQSPSPPGQAQHTYLRNCVFRI